MRTPKTYNLPFHKVRDRAPEHDQEIFYIRISRFYGDSEIRYAKVFYSWEGVTDETCGSSIIYSPEDEANPPEGFVKVMCVAGGGGLSATLDDSCLWVAATDYDALLDAAEEDEETARAEADRIAWNYGDKGMA